jgi:transposase
VAYREVGMLEIKEVLLQWLAGTPKKQIARRLGVDPKTVRRYIVAAEATGLSVGLSPPGLTEEHLTAVLVALRAHLERPRGESWDLCVAHRERIERLLDKGLRLTKARKLLHRQGIEIPYSTLHRFAVAELGFGRSAATVALADGAPGQELQLDPGRMGQLEPDARGRRRRFLGWIFTPCVSRFRFVYPCFRETTETAIEACEAAWEFYDGVFGVLLPDNTSTIVQIADPLQPTINPAFLEYAQARGFHIDPARVRRPRDKARVERSVIFVREDAFAGEQLHTIEEARERGALWSRHEAGMRHHSVTQRRPFEHFEAVEKSALKPAPTTPYDIPLWCDPKVARDQFAQVDRALYSLPTRFVGRKLRARADRQTVRFYDAGIVVKTHPRKGPGERSTDPNDFPDHKAPYALRDVAFLQRQAHRHGPSVGRLAELILEGPLPWTRMRRVYALLGLARKYGDVRVEQTCATALAVEMIDVKRLQRMLELGGPAAPAPGLGQKVLPFARHLRHPDHYALPRPVRTDAPTKEKPDESTDDLA